MLIVDRTLRAFIHVCELDVECLLESVGNKEVNDTVSFSFVNVWIELKLCF